MKCRLDKGVISHVVFTVKNSRYDWQQIKRKKSVGFIAPTYPFFENEEEESLIKILCGVALELELKIAAFNSCGDHVHAVLITDNKDISKIVGLWKGKSAYLFNHSAGPSHPSPLKNHCKNINQSLWARSYYQKIINSDMEFCNVKFYVTNNRKKHGLRPLSNSSAKLIQTIILY
jgi:REP element-mobilizing transposase RayT